MTKYDKFQDEMVGLHDYNEDVRDYYNACIDPLKKYKFDSLLDAGCGHGYVMKGIRARYPKVKLAGFDLIDHSKRQECDDMEFKVHNMLEHWPYEKDSYDIVIMAAALMTITGDKDSVIENLKRVAKKHVLLVEADKGGKFHKKIMKKHGFKNIMVKENVAPMWQKDGFVLTADV